MPRPAACRRARGPTAAAKEGGITAENSERRARCRSRARESDTTRGMRHRAGLAVRCCALCGGALCGAPGAACAVFGALSAVAVGRGAPG